MEIHNIVEDMVKDIAQDIFVDEKTSKKPHFCTCTQCLNDVICYVLNRIEPVYIYSSRGAAHFKMHYLDNIQRRADIASLVHKGINRIIKVKRPHFPHDNIEIKNEKPEGYFYNFPTITGKLLNSVTFGPVSGIEAALFFNGKLMKMINPNWQNPCEISPVTPGIFTFFAYPQEAKTPGDSKEFDLELVIDNELFEPLRHYFKVSVSSETVFADYYNYTNLFDLQDIHCIPIE
jgi:competence protein ComFB